MIRLPVPRWCFAKKWSAWLVVVSSIVLCARLAIAAPESEDDEASMPENTGTLPRAEMPTGQAPPPATSPAEETTPALVDPDGETKHPAPVEKKIGDVRVAWDGLVRVIAEAVENDPKSTYIGRNDGFRIDEARLGIRAALGDAAAYASLEAAIENRSGANDPAAELAVGPKDLYLEYAFARIASLRVGRFKAPYDVGELEPMERRVFIEKPLETRGVLPARGDQVAGLSQGRQIGAMLSSRRLGLSDAGIDLGYALAITNGKNGTLAVNDNDRPAGFVRLSLFYGPWIEISAAAFTDRRTVGELPNLLEEEVRGIEGSLALEVERLRIEAQILLQNVEHPTSGKPEANAHGGHAAWSYELYGVTLAYRFAYYDAIDRDTVTEHTIGLGYAIDELPLRFVLEGGVADESQGYERENNRIAALAQFAW